MDMSYFNCIDISGMPHEEIIKEGLEDSKCPACGSYLLSQKYKNSVMKSQEPTALSCDVNDFMLYKCSNINCGEVFLQADIKGKFYLVK